MADLCRSRLKSPTVCGPVLTGYRSAMKQLAPLEHASLPVNCGELQLMKVLASLDDWCPIRGCQGADFGYSLPDGLLVSVTDS